MSTQKSFESYEEGLAAGTLLFDPALYDQFKELVSAMVDQNPYFGAIAQLSKYIKDKKPELLKSAYEFTSKADISRENRSALYLIILSFYKKYEGHLPDQDVMRAMKDLYIDWTKTNSNILTCIRVLLPDEYEKLKACRT